MEFLPQAPPPMPHPCSDPYRSTDRIQSLHINSWWRNPKKYVRLDDEFQALKEDKRANQKQSQKKERQGYEGDHRSYLVSPRRDDLSKYKNSTPLNDSRIRIPIWIRKNDKEVRRPTKLNPEKAKRQDRSKYNHFHEAHSHTIEECRQLKDEIKMLIRDDTIRKIAKKDRKERRPETDAITPETTPDWEPMGIIHIIAKGPNDDQGK